MSLSVDLTKEEKQSIQFNEKVHLQYIQSLQKPSNASIETCMTEHMRMSGIYWGITSMAILGKEETMNLDKVVAFVLQCYHSNGGFSGNVNHDPHLLYTCHAILILAVCDALDKIDAIKTSEYVSSLQQVDGSFVGDQWGEVDTKFTYCALSVLAILKQMQLINQPLAMDYIQSCGNFDGGFGNIPGMYIYI